MTLGTAGAHKWWGNNTGSTATPSYEALTVSDLPTAIPISNVGSAGLSGTAPVAINSAGAISMHVADALDNGYLSSTDWSTFNGKQAAGTYVTAVSVASANGVSGASSGGSTRVGATTDGTTRTRKASSPAMS